jgi:uncharacterized protein YjbI with pentapeptide repeats
MREADLAAARLPGATVTHVDLAGAWLDGADLTRADLRGSDLSAIDPRNARFRGATIDVDQAVTLAGSLGLTVRADLPLP